MGSCRKLCARGGICWKLLRKKARNMAGLGTNLRSFHDIFAFSRGFLMGVFRGLHKRSGTELASRAGVADSFLWRCRGLLGRKLLRPGEGLVIKPCRMVHMMGMVFPIDVVFCDETNRIVSFQENLKPWKFSRRE